MNSEKQQDLPNENVKTVQLVYNSFLSRDFKAILEVLSDDVEWGEPSNPYNPAGGIRHGHDGFIEWLRIGRDAEDILALAPEKFLTDSDSVAVVGFTKCLAKPTNKIYESDFVHLFTFRKNKIIKFQEYFDTFIAAEAFKNKS
jgi:ketosteroid isomerase-like protein